VIGIAILTVLISAAADETAQSGWYQFRGPLRDGKSAETGLARRWGPAGPRELWRVPIDDAVFEPPPDAATSSR